MSFWCLEEWLSFVVFSEINMTVLLKAGYPWMECLFLGGMWDLQDDLVPSWLQHV